MTSNTNFEEFKKLFFRIPKELLNNVWFIELRPNSKAPVSGSWKKDYKHLNYYQIKDAMRTGLNIACVALPKGVMMIDLDTNEDGHIISPEISGLLDADDTFTVSTPSGGLHYYYLNSGNYNTQNLQYGSLVFGELRANYSYVVTPGSCTEKGKYVVEKDAPLSTLTDVTVRSLLKEGITPHEDRIAPDSMKGVKGITLPESLIEIKKKYGTNSIEWKEAYRVYRKRLHNVI